MDSWPIDNRHHPVATAGRKSKSKSQEKEIPHKYPHIEQGFNLINLFEVDGRLEWTSIVKYGEKAHFLRAGRSAVNFPPTRPPPFHKPKTTVLQEAEQGAHFLRTYLPDVDISAELIRDEVSRDVQLTRKLRNFDPQAGNLLETVTTYDPKAGHSFFAFPMGELYQDLNLSPFYQSEQGTAFQPSACSVRTLKTPIQQLSASTASFIDGAQISYLAVRTFGLTSLLEIRAGATPTAIPSLTEMATILHSDTGNRALVDITISSSPFQALAVNDHGALYKCTTIDGRKSMNLVCSLPQEMAGHTSDLFWRLAQGASKTHCLLISSKILRQVDFRVNSVLDLFSVPTKQDVLTSIEEDGKDNLIKLCSTREILWIDRRFPGKPLLGYGHGRQYDRSLEARVIPSTSLTLLTSRRNEMMTVYDISRSGEQLVHLNGPPYCLFPDKKYANAGVPCLGQTLVPNYDGTFSLIRLSNRGSLHQVDLHTVNSDCPSMFQTVWSSDIEQLNATTFPRKAVAFDGQDFTEIDLASAYDNIFCIYLKDKQKADEDNAEALYDLVEKMPTVWQELDVSVDHMLTMYDVVFRAGDDPTQVFRADFLTESVINSTRGYRALIQGRLSAQSLAEGVSWHYDLSPIMRHFRLSFSNNAESCQRTLCQYNLAEDPERSARSIRQENEAREQLALDLVLSTDIFSPSAFLGFSSKDSGLDSLTKTLSLTDEPPSFEFGYLRPLPVDHYDKAEKSEVVSIGVQALLKGWEIGKDPEGFLFTDHYGEQTVTQPAQRLEDTNRQLQPARTQLPPKLVAMTSIIPPNQPEDGRRTLVVQSQGLDMPGFTLGSQLVRPDSLQSSQDLVMSTQILPGVYGGRPSVGKKKAAKKRIGGF